MFVDHCEEAEEKLQQQQCYWILKRDEIDVIAQLLGKGAWGEVKIAYFRGIQVAAKCLYEIILFPYNLSIFKREMEIAARVKHPNLFQFIGATQEGNPIILSELMPTSVRKELEKSPLTCPQVIRIAQDICAALNYLHLWKLHIILHHDVSTLMFSLNHQALINGRLNLVTMAQLILLIKYLKQLVHDL